MKEVPVEIDGLAFSMCEHNSCNMSGSAAKMCGCEESCKTNGSCCLDYYARDSLPTDGDTDAGKYSLFNIRGRSLFMGRGGLIYEVTIKVQPPPMKDDPERILQAF